MPDDFKEIFENETLKNIFIYYTDTVNIINDEQEYPGFVNKLCVPCGKEKADECGKMVYSTLLKECSNFKDFMGTHNSQ